MLMLEYQDGCPSYKRKFILSLSILSWKMMVKCVSQSSTVPWHCCSWLVLFSMKQFITFQNKVQQYNSGFLFAGFSKSLHFSFSSFSSRSTFSSISRGLHLYCHPWTFSVKIYGGKGYFQLVGNTSLMLSLVFKFFTDM